jgi:hypothetical protein
MRFSFYFFLSSVCVCLYSQEQSNAATPPAGVNADLFDSSFFDGLLDQADTGDDALGTQRIIDLRGSTFAPSISFSTNYNYSSNPLASADTDKTWEDAFLASMTLGFNLGLGEIGLGEEVLLTPSIYLSHSRTYYDVVKDRGSQFQFLDADSQIASVSFPFVLPNDFVVRLSHTYFRPIDFRNKKSDMYINSPSFSFEKQFNLPTGGVFTAAIGAGVSLSEGSEYLASLKSAGVSDDVARTLYESLVLKGQNPAITRPTDLQDSWNHQIAFNYMHPLSEKFIAIPSFSYTRSCYTEGRYLGREDTVTSFGLNLNYSLFEWLNLSALSNYSIKDTNKNGHDVDIVDYENFVGGVAFGINHAF